MSAPRRLGEILAGAGVRPLDAVESDPLVTGVEIDSRRILPGHVFFALPGLRLDGVAFVPDAVARGASAIVAGAPRPSSLDASISWIRVEDPRRAAGLFAREWFGRPDEALPIVGITGTNGKTTVSYMVESIGRAAGLEPGRIGTVGYAHGGQERSASRTTPEAPDLFALLAQMRDRGVRVVALEVSSHALALRRVEGLRFAVAAFLNFGRDHLDFHGDAEAYFEAKARMFDELRPPQIAVLPADDPKGAALAGRTRAETITFGRDPAADVRIEDESCRMDGSAAVLRVGGRRLAVRTPLPGRFHLENAAAAAACCTALRISDAAIVEGLAALRAVPGRTERVDEGQPFAVLVDFAHTEEALARLLDGVREIVGGRLLAVFGCGGERDRGKRPLMGRAAAERADLVFLTSDNPRSEDPAAILGEVESGVASVAGGLERCRVIRDRAQAIAAAIFAARPGDVVVVAGKGHETTQSFGDHVERFDDREAAAAALAAAGWNGGRRARA